MRTPSKYRIVKKCIITKFYCDGRDDFRVEYKYIPQRKPKGFVHLLTKWEKYDYTFREQQKAIEFIEEEIKLDKHYFELIKNTKKKEIIDEKSIKNIISMNNACE